MADADISKKIKPLSLIELIEGWQITQAQLKELMPEAEFQTIDSARDELVKLLEEIGVMRKVEKVREGYTVRWTEYHTVARLNEQQYNKLEQLLPQLPIDYKENNNCLSLTRYFSDVADDFKRSCFLLFKPLSS